jgi:hypothetical protein
MADRFRHGRSARVAALVVAVVVAGVARGQPQDPFAAGTAAFARGDYAQALSLFQGARSTDSAGAALEYNIGVCQYRIGQYADAEATFRGLAGRYPSFAALAEYNRGLALLALERRDEAAAAFERARAGGDERLAGLAASALAEVRGASPPSPPRPWNGYLSVAAGHDDNVALVDQLSLPANVPAASPLTEVLGYARHQTATRIPLRIDLSGYAVRYADSTVFDQNTLRIDTTFLWGAGPSWRLEAGPYFSNSMLDGDGFERTLGAQVRAIRGIGNGLAFDVRFVYDDIQSPTTRFDFVAGTRERLRFGLEHTDVDRFLRVAYERESQNRASPSVSPERGRLMLTLSRRVSARWFFDGNLAHRVSRYDELAVPRKERLAEITVAARRELPSGWLLSTDYRWADNNSNVALFAYTSRRITVGVSRVF